MPSHSVATEEYTLKDKCSLEFDRLFWLLRKQSWGNHLGCELLRKVFTCVPEWKY